MPIVYRYITREIAIYFGIVLATIVGIYIAVDFFEKVDNFLAAGLPISRVITFLIFKSPFIIAFMMPIGVLLSVLVVFGLMSKHNEIVALKSSGISIYYLVVPVLSIGLIMSLLLFAMSEIVVPATTAYANRIWLSEVKKKAVVASRHKNLWIRGDGIIVNIKHYNPMKDIAHKIVIHSFDENFALSKRVDAEKAVFKDGKWHFINVIEQIRDGTSGAYHSRHYDEKDMVFSFLPEDLKHVVKKSDEMNFWELWEYIKEVESEGYDATLYHVDLHAKIAFPWVCLIMSLIATGLSAHGIKNASLPIRIGLGIGIAFLYWFCYSFCLSLGYGGVLPPMLSAWVTNFFFLCLGGYMLLNAE